MTGSVQTALIAAVFGLIGGFISPGLDYYARKEEMSIKMIEIAVGILTAKPDDSIKPARQWAVSVISKYAGKMDVPLDESVKNALYENPLPFGVGSLETGALGTEVLGTGVLGGPSPD